jgi:hypothetical protein
MAGPGYRAVMQVRRAAIAACCLIFAGCANAIVKPGVTPPATPTHDALLVLPGFGYGGAGETAFRSLAPAMAADGLDLYLPTFISRSGLAESRERLQRFVREQRLDRYERVHVFAFLAGGWTFNPLAERDVLPNVSTVIYDRSPYQERAPRVARENVPLLTWVRYGNVVFDVAKTPYAPLMNPDIKIGLVVETVPTKFIQRFADSARRQGPYNFTCGAFNQRYDDCMYVALNHNELYAQFAKVWPEVRSFVKAGHFTASANRTAPDLPR